MKNWKKSLFVAGVLASLLAGSAFAATEAEDAATQQKGLEYNNKIEQNAPDMEKGRPPFGFKRTDITGPARVMAISAATVPKADPVPVTTVSSTVPKAAPVIITTASSADTTQI